MTEAECETMINAITAEARSSWPGFEDHRGPIAVQVAMLPVRHTTCDEEVRRFAEEDLLIAYATVMVRLAGDALI